jgi:hypothetical protein
MLPRDLYERVRRLMPPGSTDEEVWEIYNAVLRDLTPPGRPASPEKVAEARREQEQFAVWMRPDPVVAKRLALLESLAEPFPAVTLPAPEEAPPRRPPAGDPPLPAEADMVPVAAADPAALDTLTGKLPGRPAGRHTVTRHAGPPAGPKEVIQRGVSIDRPPKDEAAVLGAMPPGRHELRQQ